MVQAALTAAPAPSATTKATRASNAAAAASWDAIPLVSTNTDSRTPIPPGAGMAKKPAHHDAALAKAMWVKGALTPRARTQHHWATPTAAHAGK